MPAAHGRAFRVEAGQRLRLSSPKGGQCADFFAFTPDLGEWLSPMHTWVASRHVRPRADDVFVSQRRRPLLDFAEDGAGGVHDMLLAACDTDTASSASKATTAAAPRTCARPCAS